MRNLCSFQSKDLKFGRNHHHGLGFMLNKFQGHINTSKVKYDNVFYDFYEFLPPSNKLKP